MSILHTRFSRRAAPLSSSLLVLGAALTLGSITGCGDEEPGSSPGGASGAAGASAGSAGSGAAGKAGGASGQGGAAGAGQAGSSGQSGAGTAGQGGAGQAGASQGGAGQGGAGQGGEGGAGAAGQAGAAGEGPIGVGGRAGGAAGASGEAGQAGGGGEAGTGGSAGGAGQAGAAGAGPVKPPECGVLTLAGPLKSSQVDDPEYYDAQPDLYVAGAIDGASGDPAHPNTFIFYLDAENKAGAHPVAPLVPYPYVISNGGILVSDYAGGDAPGYTKRFLAVSGSIEVTSVLTPHQTEGALVGIRLDEAELQEDFTYKLTPGGKCYWLEKAAWSTKREGGCKPFSDDACGDGRFCMPTNAIGDDGLCVTTGAKKVGESCALVADGKHDSDCAPGLRCARFEDEGETAFTCHQLCDVRSTSPGCPADRHCGGGYSVCISTAFLQNHPDNGDEIDSVAKVGEECKETPDALYCGADGQPGTCFTYSGETASICRPFRHALSECEPGESAGYVTYKNGIDSSTLLCFK